MELGRPDLAQIKLVLVSFWLRAQPVDATHWLNLSAGVSKSNVFLGLSLSCLAIAFSFLPVLDVRYWPLADILSDVRVEAL